VGVPDPVADAVVRTPALTGIRGAAALWVAAYHLLLPAHFVSGVAATMLGRGYLAVDLFFILSGYVMALNYGGLFRYSIDIAQFARFLLKRAARLYPIYAAILVPRLIYTALRYGRFDLPRPWIAAPLPHPWLDIPANLLLVQAWGFSPSSIGPAWSISTEWAAYFLFPGVAVAALWRGRAWAGTVFAAAIALLAATAAVDAGGGYHEGALDAWDGMTTGPLLRCFAGFSLGVLLWRLSGWAPAARIASTAAACAATLVALMAALAFGAPDLAIYPLFPALVLCLACGRNTVTGVFAWPKMLWLGEVSYSLYLLHIFLLHPLDVTRAAARGVLPATVADIAAVSAMFAVLLMASGLSYRWIEQPGRRLIMALAPVRKEAVLF
jgi:peptidoglycan/LPS O-acetylase OafA/YrhL